MNDMRDSLPNHVVAELPPLSARFCIPRLVDKPQNPIVDTLKLLDNLNVLPVQSTLLLRRETKDSPANLSPLDPFYTGDPANIWQRVRDGCLSHEARSFSLKTRVILTHLPDQPPLMGYMATLTRAKRDAITIHFRTASTCFCRESPFVCNHKGSFSRSYLPMLLDSIRPQLSNTTTEIIYVEQSELLTSLRLTLMGATSNLHVWDPQQECFILRGMQQGKDRILSIVGKDETVTHRLAPFIPKAAWS